MVERRGVDAGRGAETGTDRQEIWRGVREAHAELHVAHALQSVPTTRFERFVRASLLEEARELLDRQAAQLGEAGAEVAGAHLREGPAADEVIDLAGEIGADLVVVGSRGLGPLGRARLGSVSTKVLRAAKGPVLICPGPHDSGHEEGQG